MTATRSPEYGTVARMFHWLTAVLVFVQLLAGLAMTSEAIPELNDAFFIMHKGLGCVFLLVIAARLVWTLTHPVSVLLPGTAAPQRRLASLTHRLLYVLLILLPVSGYIRTVGDGYPIELLDALGIPPLVSGIPDTAHVMLVVHKVGGYLLVGLIAAHVAAAVYHALDRDGVLSRMWPPVRPHHADTRR